jgi:hypothetical protein
VLFNVGDLVKIDTSLMMLLSDRLDSTAIGIVTEQLDGASWVDYVVFCDGTHVTCSWFELERMQDHI